MPPSSTSLQTEEEQAEGVVVMKVTPGDERQSKLIDSSVVDLSAESLEPISDVEKPRKEEKKEKKAMVSLFQLLFTFAGTKEKLLMFAGFCGGVAQGAALPCFSLLFGFILNGLNESDPNALLDTVSQFAIWLTVIGCGCLVAGWIQLGFWSWSAERQAIRMREGFLRSVLRQEMAWFDGQRPGEMSARISSDVRMISDAIGYKFGQLIQYYSSFFVGLLIGFIKGWQLALVILGAAPLMAIAAALGSRAMAASTKLGKEAYAKAGSVADEALTSIRTVAAFNGEQHEFTRYKDCLKFSMIANIKKGVFSGLSVGLMMFAMFGSYSLAFWFGSWLIDHDVTNPTTGKAYTGGDVVTVFFSVIMGAQAMGQAAPLMPVLADGRSSMFSVLHVYNRTSAIDPFSTAGATIPKLLGNVRLEHVHFSYSTRSDLPILRGLTLDVPAGSTVALVGASGCGKTTAMQLMSRLYDPEGGRVLVDGQDLKSLNVRWWRENLGIVSQEPVLFATSIEDNIRMGRQSATHDDIIAAAKMSNAHDFISQLPAGYGTYIGDVGSLLSGGQKQRIAIARALIRQPKILLLDEATSALDAENECIVQDALDKLMAGRTTVVIAHRLSTIKKADCIYVLEGGQVIECGKHDQLIAKDGAYAHLVHLQAMAASTHSAEPSAADKDAPLHRQPSMRPHSTISAPSHLPRQPSDVPPKGVPADALDGKLADDKDAKQPKVLGDVAPTGKRPIVPWGRIVRMSIVPAWPWFVLGAIAAAGCGVVFPFFAIIFSQMLTVFYKFEPFPGQSPEDFAAMEADARQEAIFWACMFVVLGAALFIGFWGNLSLLGRVNEQLTYQLRLDSFKALLRQEIAYFDDEHHAAGILTTALEQDAALVQGATTFRLGTTIQTMATLTTALILAFSAGPSAWKLALVVIAIMPLLGVSAFFQTRMVARSAGATKDSYEKAGKLAGEAIANVRTVSSFTGENQVLREYTAHLHQPARASIIAGHISGISFGASMLVLFSSEALAFWYGATLIQSGELTFTAMMRVFMALIMAAMGVGHMNSVGPDLQHCKEACASIFPLLDRQPKIDASATHGDRTAVVAADVELKEVVFAYPTRPEVQVLRGLNLHIPAGRTTALVGMSGCGKSTVMALLLRFYDPLAGTVLVDSRDIRTISVPTLRNTIAIVSQEPVLFATSIRDNIKYGLSNVRDEEMEAAARVANIHDFISSLPAKYDTQVGPRGSQLSGGQKQRIAIARAVVRNPKILLLDEATSALDTHNEKIVQAALDGVSAGRTTIAIAHRLSTIQKAHHIVVLQHGTVAEQGTHDDLVHRNGLYAALVRRSQLTAVTSAP